MLKRKIANWLLKHLFNAVTEDDVLVYKNGKLYLQGIELSQEQFDAAVAEASMIKSYRTWDLLIKAMQWEANRQMYETAKTTDDLLFGKAMLYTLDILQQKITNLSKLK